MVKIIEPKIETAELKSDGTYGRFVVEPLDRGFGTTLGNSLRRVLLSSLPGVAVTSIKIDGVQHEFSTIEGVKEDVTEIVLNIKGLTAKLTVTDQRLFTSMLRVKAKLPLDPSSATLMSKFWTQACTLQHLDQTLFSVWRLFWTKVRVTFPLKRTNRSQR